MNFIQISHNSDDTDPIFKESNYRIYSKSDRHFFDTPLLYSVGEYRFVLVNPKDFGNDEDLCFKVATYLYHHKVIQSKNKIYTYFFGDINKCKEIGEDFSNQICKYISYEMLEEWYPKNLTDINDKVVNFFLEQQEYYGQSFSVADYDMNYLLFIPKTLDEKKFRKSRYFLLYQLEANGYFVAEKWQNHYMYLSITADAISQFQKTKNKESNTAFIAIKFKGNEERIKAIQDTVADCGYEPRIMTEYQTNDWIMPEIFHQIQLSKFVVVDLSLRCDGAYYEAGYAHAMGKPVIHLYDEREKENNPLHFDVAQKSTVIYNNLDDLKEKLTKRIEATVN